MNDPFEIKTASTKIALDLVLKNIEYRQSKGYISKNMGASQKNAIALKFVDLHQRVIKDQKLAMIDSRLEKLSKRQL